MKYPDFFDTVEVIKLKDQLSDFLGTFEDGIVEFNYLDVVKMSGHSCPTVAGAYIMTLVGLKELYVDEIPKRGEIKVFFKEDSTSGVTGVIANVVTQITGATDTTGFKGINGKFQRFDLMKFNQDLSSSIKFQRVDNSKSVELIYDPSIIEADPLIPTLMQKIFASSATQEETIMYKNLWQTRVKEIFNNIDKVLKVKK